jgi:hypothetical protein
MTTLASWRGAVNEAFLRNFSLLSKSAELHSNTQDQLLRWAVFLGVIDRWLRVRNTGTTYRIEIAGPPEPAALKALELDLPPSGSTVGDRD